MQATKQRPSGGKKSATSNKLDASKGDGKSVAQRVMDVSSGTASGLRDTSHHHSLTPTANSNKSSSTASNQLQRLSASIESDQEVEEITNRVANLKKHDMGDQNNNSTKCASNKSDGDSPDLLLYEETLPPNGSKSQCCRNGGTIGFNNLVNNSMVGDSNKICQKILSPSSSHQISSLEQSRDRFGLGGEADISLDTKVPHPMKSTTTSNNKKFQLPNQQEEDEEEEEVSYYNDHQLAPLSKSVTIEKKVMVGHDEPMKSCSFKDLHQHQQQQTESNNSREYINQAEVFDENHYSVDNIVEDRQYDNADAIERASQEKLNRQGQGQDQLSSTSTSSPKAKSAPATPSNVTPTALHQHTSYLDAMLNPANTLPSDIRKNISATCRVVPTGVEHQHQAMMMNKQMRNAHLDELMTRGNEWLEKKDYNSAIEAYSRCIELATNQANLEYLKHNFVYNQRAEAYFNLGLYHQAIEDSIEARNLNPKFAQVYYRQGQSQFLLGNHADALAVFAYGLAQDSSDTCLLESLVDCALKSSFRSRFEPKYSQLKSVEMNKKPFVVVSVLGQDLLADKHEEHAAIVLESAVKIGTENKKLLGSVMSSLSYAYFRLKDYEKSIAYMQKDLEIENELEDISGQCRALSNLGFTYYKMSKFDKSLESHRKSNDLAMRAHLFQWASMGLNAAGHVHVARNDFICALTSHTRCLEILKQLGDNDYDQFKELLSIGYIHSMLSDYKQAEEKYQEGISLLKQSKKLSRDKYTLGMVLVNFNLAHLAVKKQSVMAAKEHYMKVIKLTEDLAEPERSLYQRRALSCDKSIDLLHRN